MYIFIYISYLEVRAQLRVAKKTHEVAGFSFIH